MITKHGMIALLILPWLWACTATQGVHLDGNHGAITYKPSPELQPVVVGQSEFLDTVSRLVLDARFSLRSEGEDFGHIRFASWHSAQPSGTSFLSLSVREKRNLALSFALDTVWDGVASAVKATINPVALRAMLSAALCAYMMLLAAPEPVTKFVAIALAAYMAAYVGIGPLWNMVEAFRQLRDQSKSATSFAQLEEIGHRFGNAMGDNGARVLIMVIMAAAGGRGGLAAKGPTLPGYAEAALVAETHAGLRLAAVAAGEVESIGITAGALTVRLTPIAVAMTAAGTGRDSTTTSAKQFPSGKTPAYPGNDPTKAPGPGWEWRGQGPPGSAQGNWINPSTRESLHPDLNHPEPIGPHWDYKDPSGNWFRINPDGSVVPK